MDKRQTAVEWLIQRMKHICKYEEYVMLENMGFIEQAKQMETEQKKKYLKEYFDWHKSMGFISHKPEDMEEFNETYGKE